ncbi:MAG: DUF3159 domain-containing protein [Actinomycetaceae bacterium]|nr:DUF3159 domain-containing protein [Actinomycetaceae bacterium]MDY6083094.1 DUF3159 domain-containing protein [Actinomycetaceae bacterium]
MKPQTDTAARARQDRAQYGDAANAENAGASASRALGAVIGDQFNIWEAMGGARGLTESSLPTVVFVVLLLVTHSLGLAVLVPCLMSIGAFVVRLVRREDLSPAVSGLVAILISALWAFKSGDATNFYMWGIVTNGVYLALLLVTIAVRKPAMGILIGWMRGDALSWTHRERGESAERIITRRRYTIVTWIWVGMFALRLVVEVPLKLGGYATALGIAKIGLGPILFAVVLMLSWYLVRSLPPVPGMPLNS